VTCECRVGFKRSPLTGGECVLVRKPTTAAPEFPSVPVSDASSGVYDEDETVLAHSQSSSRKGFSSQEEEFAGDGSKCILGQAEKHATRILGDVLKRYDRNLVPKVMGVDVEVELLIQKVSEINEIQSSSKMDIMLSQIWHDPGLNFEVGLI